MTLQTEYTMHTDPGHGWLEVPASEVDYMRVPVSGYSYRSRDGAKLYLEEDCDAGNFLAFRLAFSGRDPANFALIGPAGSGRVLTVHGSNTPRSDSFVRSLPGVGPLHGWGAGMWGAAAINHAREAFAASKGRP